MTDPDATPPPTPPTPAPKRLVRGCDDSMLGGVCSGVADYLGVDVTLVRLLTVLGAVFGLGSLVVAYVVLWIVLPQE
jgi:phage shock protein PspC (stress-responsive transcriptional regulator)